MSPISQNSKKNFSMVYIFNSYDFEEVAEPLQNNNNPIVSISARSWNDILSLSLADKNTVKRIVIEENCSNSLPSGIEICGFERLETIVVKKNALKNVPSLTVKDNPHLISFVTKDGDTKRDAHNAAFEKCKYIVFSSSSILEFIDEIFLYSLLSLLVINHFVKQEHSVYLVYHYDSFIIQFDLPSLNQLTVGQSSFQKVTSFSLSSLMNNRIIDKIFLN